VWICFTNIQIETTWHVVVIWLRYLLTVSYCVMISCKWLIVQKFRCYYKLQACSLIVSASWVGSYTSYSLPIALNSENIRWLRFLTTNAPRHSPSASEGCAGLGDCDQHTKKHFFACGKVDGLPEFKFQNHLINMGDSTSQFSKKSLPLRKKRRFPGPPLKSDLSQTLRWPMRTPPLRARRSQTQERR
jgi:hypothetical protein